MKTLKKITNFVSGNMAVIVIVVAAIALFSPQTVSFLKTSYVNPLLGVVMFGMGLTLKPQDFKVVFSRPKDVIIGCIAQFTVMPLLAFGLTKVFGLSTELAIGVILVGTCPGGTSSNVMTYLSKGDVALSGHVVKHKRAHRGSVGHVIVIGVDLVLAVAQGGDVCVCLRINLHGIGQQLRLLARGKGCDAEL